MDKRTDKHTNEQTKVPLCSTGLCPLGAAVQKKQTIMSRPGNKPTNHHQTWRLIESCARHQKNFLHIDALLNVPPAHQCVLFLGQRS